MYAHTTDYRAQQEKPKRGTLADSGFWIHDIPRPLLTCKVLGHIPVVEGHGTPGEHRGHVARWVCCDRCGVRPYPQGNLDPIEWQPGQPYTGPFDGKRIDWKALTPEAFAEAKQARSGTAPGPWPERSTWTFGGQAVLGRTLSGFSAQVKIGNRGSEQDLAAHISLNPIGALYIHTESLGAWLVRRLNPVGYESRVIGFSVHEGTLHWELWAKRNERSSTDPRWQQGSINLSFRDRLLGALRYSYTNEGDPVTVTVRFPHGDDHEVKLQLQHQEYGREKRPRRRKKSWTVDWDVRGGIPTKPGDRGRICAAAVEVSDAGVKKGMWPLEASAAIAQKITAWRIREGMSAYVKTETEATS